MKFKLLIFLFCLLQFNFSYALLDIEITQGNLHKISLLLQKENKSDSAKLLLNNPYQDLTSIIKSDLEYSGIFKITDDRKYDNLPHNIDYKLKIGIEHFDNVKFRVNIILSDNNEQNMPVLSKSFMVHELGLRYLSHHISDLIYEKLTGIKGIFSTKIAYVKVLSQNAVPKYILEIADFDGKNSQPLVVSNLPIMSPSWHPNGREIAFVSFANHKSEIKIVTLDSGNIRTITSYDGINGAPSWSPDGKKLALVLSKNGNPKIFILDIKTNKLKQLTFGYSIDTEPNWSANGHDIIFTSSRGGGAQIYQVTLDSLIVKRLTFDGNYNARASFTSDQRHLVMIHRDSREESVFNIAVEDLNTGEMKILTTTELEDESPSLAPNGHYIVYATKYQNKGILSLVSLDGLVKVRLPDRDGDVQEPAWSR